MNLHVHLIFLKSTTWQDLDIYITRFNDWKKNEWDVKLIPTTQKELYILEFKKEGKKTYTYWYVAEDSNDILAFYSFSMQVGEIVQSTLESFVNFTPGIWFAWLGSYFLENFDNFINEHFENGFDILYENYTCEISEKREETGKIIKTRVEYERHPSKEEYIKEKQIMYEKLRRLISLKRIKCRFQSGDEICLKMSISEYGHLLIENGDLSLFMEIVRKVMNHAITDRNDFKKKTRIVRKQFSPKENFQLEVLEVEDIEVLIFSLQETRVEEWFENLTAILRDETLLLENNILCFEEAMGNPFIHTHLIDMESKSSIDLLAFRDAKIIKIVPSNRETEAEMVSTILSLLQTFVDPDLTRGDSVDNGST
jgi:hypothetical protein